jgi:hypothetical protein
MGKGFFSSIQVQGGERGHFEAGLKKTGEEGRHKIR